MSVDVTTVRVQWAYPDHDNFVSDNRGQGGGAGWFMPTTGRSYKREEYSIPSLDYTLNSEQGPYMVFDTTGTSGVAYSRFYNIGHAQYQAAVFLDIGRTSTSPSVTVDLEAYDAAGNFLGLTTATGSGQIQTATATGWTRISRYVSGQHPAIGKVRIKLTGVGVYAVRNVFIEDDDFNDIYWNNYNVPDSASNTNLRGVWNDVTPKVQAVSIRRGSRPNPPVDQLEIGTASIHFGTKPTNTQATYGPLRPGSRVRVQGKSGTNWETVFEGFLSEIVDVVAVGKEPGYTEWRVTDRVAPLARSSVTSIRGTTLSQRIESVLNPTPEAGNVGPSIRFQNFNTTPLLGNEASVVDEDGNKLDYLLTIRNGDFGLLYCDKTNQLQYVSGAAGVPDRRGKATWTFAVNGVTTGQKTPLLSDYDREQVDEYAAVNSLRTTRLSGADTFGAEHTKRIEALIYGKRLGDFAFISTSYLDTKPLIDAYFAMHARGTTPRAIDQFKYDATKDVASAALFELYDDVSINPVSAYDTYRIIGLEHEIRPGSWQVRFTVRRKEGSARSTTSNYDLVGTP